VGRGRVRWGRDDILRRQWGRGRNWGGIIKVCAWIDGLAGVYIRRDVGGRELGLGIWGPWVRLTSLTEGLCDIYGFPFRVPNLFLVLSRVLRISL
jgi:hypothetical protein